MDLDELRAFVAVADRGSFLAAADDLYLSRTTLRRLVESLEVKAGTALFRRTRRGVSLTEAGLVLQSRGRLLMQEAEALLSSVRDVGKEPAGTLRVVLPAGLPPQAFPPLFSALRSRCPRLSVRIRLQDDPAAHLLDDVDVAICFGVAAPVGPWEIRQIVEVREWLVASDHYLARHGAPSSIDDLARHTLLAWDAPGGDPNQWTTLGGGTFAVEPMLVTSDVHMLRLCAQSGLGIAFLPDALIADMPGSPTLRPVLPDIVGRRRAVRAVIPSALVNIPKIRAVLDLLDLFARDLTWIGGSDPPSQRTLG